jgi:hypothetical protein
VLASLTIGLAAQPWLAERVANIRIRNRIERIATAEGKARDRMCRISKLFRVTRSFLAQVGISVAHDG